MKRILLENLLGSQVDLSYENQYRYIMELLSQNKIRPVLASGTNGKKPALYREYWLTEERKDYHVLEEELKYQITPQISVDFYLKHPDLYEQDRTWVLLLNDYLKTGGDKLKHQESVNERSFEIWNREKFLSREQGKKILKRCGVRESDLNMYATTEPLAYYSHTRKIPQNLLILENKDTFYSMRRHLLEGNDRILGIETGTLIYGAGKAVMKSFRDFDLCVEPYMKAVENRIYYFGDLDYEGIGIYEGLAEMFDGRWRILPFVPGYEAMLRKAKQIVNLPDPKEQQNQRNSGLFFSYFTKDQVGNMEKILKSRKYIPQEILNIADF